MVSGHFNTITLRYTNETHSLNDKLSCDVGVLRPVRATKAGRKASPYRVVQNGTTHFEKVRATIFTVDFTRRNQKYGTDIMQLLVASTTHIV